MGNPKIKRKSYVTNTQPRSEQEIVNKPNEMADWPEKTLRGLTTARRTNHLLTLPLRVYRKVEKKWKPICTESNNPTPHASIVVLVRLLSRDVLLLATSASLAFVSVLSALSALRSSSTGVVESTVAAREPLALSLGLALIRAVLAVIMVALVVCPLVA